MMRYINDEKRGIMKKLFISLVMIILLANFSHASPVISHITEGITGSIIKLDVEDLGQGREVIVGTSTGVFIFDGKGVLINHFPTTYPITDLLYVNDLTGDGDRDIVVSTTDQDFPNVQMYNSRTGELIWTFKPTIPAYDLDLMWIDKETKTWDLEILPDINSDNLDEILVASGNKVYLLDGKTGVAKWAFNATNDVWNVKSIGDKILVGSQDGILYALDVQGSLMWQIELIAPFEVIDLSTNNPVGNVKRSVWDIILTQEQIITVSGENGYIYQVNIDNGNIIQEKQIIEFDDNLLYAYYGTDKNRLLPSGPNTDNFFNLRLKKIPDLNQDGIDEIIATTFMGTSSSRNQDQKGGYSLKNKIIHLLDGDSVEEIWHTKEIDITKTKQFSTYIDNDKKIVIPEGKRGKTELIKTVNLEKEIVNINFNTTAVSGGSGNFYFIENYDDYHLIMASDQGDLTLIDTTGKIQWVYPRYQELEINSVDLNSDGTEDIFVRSVERKEREKKTEEGSTRMMYMLDGTSNNMLWLYKMGFNEYYLTGGLNNIRIIDDVNNDNYRDIMAYVQRKGDWDRGDSKGLYTRIIVFDGKSGNEIWKKPVVENTYYGVYDILYRNISLIPTMFDYDEDTITQLEIEREFAQRKLQNPDTLDYDKWQRYLEEREQAIERQYRMRDQIDQLMGELPQRKEEFKVNRRIISIEEIEDQNSDGVKDLIVSCWYDVYVISSKDGKLLWLKTRDAYKHKDPFASGEGNKSLEWSFLKDADRSKIKVVEDINEDGIQDLLVFTHRRILLAQSGINYTLKWMWKPSSGDYDQENLMMIEDVNGDGIKDIFIDVWSEDGPSTYKILNSRNGKEIMQINRDGTMMDWNVADLDGDNHKDSLIFRKWSDSGPILEVKSGDTGQTIYTYDGIDETYMLESRHKFAHIMPAGPIDDFNEDGVDDLVIIKSRLWQKGIEIIIIDVKNNEQLQKIEYDVAETENEDYKRYQPAVWVNTINDLSGDGRKEIAIVGVFTIENEQEEAKVIIFDLNKKRVLREFKVKADKVFSVGNNKNIYITTVNGDVYLIDSSWSNPILEPLNDAVVQDEFELKWNQEKNTLNTIFFNNQKVKEVDGDSHVLNIKGGKHEIALQTKDRLGNTVFDYIEIKVKRSTVATTLINIIILFAIIAFIIYNINKHRKRKGLSPIWKKK